MKLQKNCEIETKSNITSNDLPEQVDDDPHNEVL